MATRNSMTPSGGIFRSQRDGGLIGFGNPQTMGRARLEQIGDIFHLYVPGARTPVRQETRPVTEFLSEITFRRRAQRPLGTPALQPTFIPQRTQLPQRPTQPPHQPMH